MQIKLKNIFNSKNKEQYSKYLQLIPDFKKEKTQKFTTIVLTLMAIIILAIFAINPTLSTIANLQKQLDDAKFVKQKLDLKINNLSTLQTKYNNLGADLNFVFGAVPQKAEVSIFTGQIQAIAKNSNVDLKNFQASNIIYSNINNFYYYEFSATIQGNYQNLLNFIDKSISMQRVVSVKNINLSQASGNDAQGLLQLNLNGITFFK